MAGGEQQSTMLNNNYTEAFDHYWTLEYVIIISHGVPLLKLNKA
jgi:hypothetical protein